MSVGSNSRLVFYVNGKKVIEENADPETTVLQYLRSKLGLTGTKLGCGEGGCGVCTVMISSHYSVNSCLAPLCAMHGLAVTTVEGIGSAKNGLHPVQERLAKSHGTQCGFCTPGTIMSMYTLLRNDPQPSTEHMEKTFEGNLCRCTGYRPIMEGFKTFTRVPPEIVNSYEYRPLDPTQDPIFPPELQNSSTYNNDLLVFRGERVIWYRPTSLDELLDLKAQYPEARLLVGNTEIGMEVKFKNMTFPVPIAPTHIHELPEVSHTDFGIRFGILSPWLLSIENSKAPYRNTQAIGGNIITASPISDLNPLFLASGAALVVQSRGSTGRQIKMDHTFFLGYRKTAIKSEEILLNIHLPFTRKNEYMYGYKQAHIREDDIATVNAGMRVLFEDNSNIISEIAIAYGGMAPITTMTCFFFKFFLTVQSQLNNTTFVTENNIPANFKSVTSTFYRGPTGSSQMYTEVASRYLEHGINSFQKPKMAVTYPGLSNCEAIWKYFMIGRSWVRSSATAMCSVLEQDTVPHMLSTGSNQEA